MPRSERRIGSAARKAVFPDSLKGSYRGTAWRAPSSPPPEGAAMAPLDELLPLLAAGAEEALPDEPEYPGVAFTVDPKLKPRGVMPPFAWAV